jgi:ABC-type branched-subunit amino acid transport system ATPase component
MTEKRMDEMTKAREIVTEWMGMFDPPPQIDFQQSEFLQQSIASALAAQPAAPAMDEMTKALQAEDARQAKLHELLETIREQIRLEVLPEHRPKGLFQNIQDAVYAM